MTECQKRDGQIKSRPPAVPGRKIKRPVPPRVPVSGPRIAIKPADNGRDITSPADATMLENAPDLCVDHEKMLQDIRAGLQGIRDDLKVSTIALITLAVVCSLCLFVGPYVVVKETDKLEAEIRNVKTEIKYQRGRKLPGW